jgi:hypothetical protein
MRVFKNKWFAKFATGESISDTTLWEIVEEAEVGKIDADYGGGVIKQRLARPNQGKSGGYRMIILYRKEEKAYFVYGFPKSERANIDKAEVRAFKDLAKLTLALSEEDITKLIKDGVYKEIKL